MRRRYPYLQDPYIYNSNEELEKRNFLSRIDKFVNQKQYVRITLLNWEEEPIKEIAGIISSGSMNKDGSSSIRTTCNLTCEVSYKEYDPQDLEADFAINKKIFIELGVKNDTDEYPEYPILWFPQGVFFISTFSMSSSSTSSVSLSIGLKDKMCALNGEVGGVFPITTNLDVVETQLKTGAELQEQKVLIYNIIREVVNHFGGEDLNNIVIEDVPQRIRQLVAWNGTKPLYLIRGTTKEYGDTTEEDGWIYQFTLKKPDEGAVYITYNQGDTVGYKMTDFVYPKELTMNAGQSVVNALDQIKNTLGNYEYFYDEYGIFHFREIKNYLNTTQGKLILDEVSENQYLVEFDNSKSVYSFTDADNIVSISVNPDYSNIKNDFVVFGNQESTSKETSVQIMYHLAIDDKPEYLPGEDYYATYGQDSNIDTDDEILILYNEPETKLQVASFVKTVDKLPDIGNTNLVYRDLKADEGQQFVYWDSESLKYKILSGSEEINKEVFQVRTIEKRIVANGDTYAGTVMVSPRTVESDGPYSAYGVITAKASKPGGDTPWEFYVGKIQPSNLKGMYASKAAAKKAAKKYVREKLFKGRQKNFSGHWTDENDGTFIYNYEGYIPRTVKYQATANLKLYPTYSKAKTKTIKYIKRNDISSKIKKNGEYFTWNLPNNDGVGYITATKKTSWFVDLPNGGSVKVPSLTRAVTILKNRVKRDVFKNWSQYTTDWEYFPSDGMIRYVVKGYRINSNMLDYERYSIIMANPIAQISGGERRIIKVVKSPVYPSKKVTIVNVNYGQPTTWKVEPILKDQTFSSIKQVKKAVKQELDKIYESGHYKGNWLGKKMDPYFEAKKIVNRSESNAGSSVNIYYGDATHSPIGQGHEQLNEWLYQYHWIFNPRTPYEVLDFQVDSNTNYSYFLFFDASTNTTIELSGKYVTKTKDKTEYKYEYNAEIYKKLGRKIWESSITNDSYLDLKSAKDYSEQKLKEILFNDGIYNGKWVKKNNGYHVFAYNGVVNFKGEGGTADRILDVSYIKDEYDTRKEAIDAANVRIKAYPTLETPAPTITYWQNITEISKDHPRAILDIKGDKQGILRADIEVTGPTKVHIPSMQKVAYPNYKWIAKAKVTRKLTSTNKFENKHRYLYEFYDTDYEAAYAINDFIHSFGCTKNFKLNKPFDVEEKFTEYTQFVTASVTKFDNRIVPRTDANTVVVFDAEHQYECKDWRTKLYLDGKRASILGLDKGYYYEELNAFWPQMYDLNYQIFYGENNDEYEESYMEYEFSGIIYWNRNKKEHVFNATKTGLFNTFSAARNCARDFAEQYNLLDTEDVQPNGKKKVTWKWTREKGDEAHPRAFVFSITPKETFIEDEINEHTEFKTLTEGCYYLDFINAPTAELGKYGVNTIGRRTVTYNKNNDVNCLFMPDVPDIDIISIEEDLLSDFVSTDSTAATYTTIEDKRKESLEYGHNYTQVNGDIFNNLVNQTNIYSAYDEIKNQLYMHTYYQTTLAITAIPVFYLQPNSRVHVTENSTNTNGDYVIKSINYTLGPGANMNVSLNQVAEKM